MDQPTVAAQQRRMAVVSDELADRLPRVDAMSATSFAWSSISRHVALNGVRPGFCHLQRAFVLLVRLPIRRW